jgi:hypothetical protein
MPRNVARTTSAPVTTTIATPLRSRTRRHRSRGAKGRVTTSAMLNPSPAVTGLDMSLKQFVTEYQQAYDAIGVNGEAHIRGLFGW